MITLKPVGEAKPTILVVDDDPTVAGMLAELLRDEGYDVDCVGDGAAVLQILSRRNYDLMLLDVLLPHVSGFALMSQIRSMPVLKSLPVIMMSGIYRGRNHRTQSLELLRAIEYLDKPLQIDRLLALIREHIHATPAVPNEGAALRRATQSRAKAEIEETEADSATYITLIDSDSNQERLQVEKDARRQFRPSAFVMQGSLSALPVAPLLGRLWRERATGGLLLRKNKIKKIVYLRDGTPYTVKSNLVSECLGNVLVTERIISREQCEKSIEAMRESGKKQGQLLLEMRSLTRKNLELGLKLQLDAKIYSMFAWEQGEYRFNPAAPLPDTDKALAQSAAALIAEGVRRSLDETHLRSRMAHALDVTVRLRDERVDGSEYLTPDEKRMLRTARFPCTTQQWLENPATDPGLALRIAYMLIALEVLVPATSA